MDANTPRHDNDVRDPNTQSIRVSRAKGDDQNIRSRLSLGFYKLTWRTPLHNMRISGKVPLRLLANPQDKLPADIARGQAIRMGQFHLRGQSQKITDIDYEGQSLPPAMVDYIHRFDWLRDLAAATYWADGAPDASTIAKNWLAANTEKIREPAWRIDNCTWRLLNMAAWSPFILSSKDPIYRSRLINHLARTARHLDQSAPRTSPGCLQLTAWTGVVAASLLLPEGKIRRAVGESGLTQAISETIFPDGGIMSRSPVQLIELMRLLYMLRQCYSARDEETPDFLISALGRMAGALLGLTHADGDLGAWQGSARIGAEFIGALVNICDDQARPQPGLDWGYQRVSAGTAILVFDGGPPPLAKQSPSGCASTLAFEFSHGTQKLVINCGGSAMLSADQPSELRRGLRTTAAHSTLCIDNKNSTAILPEGQLGRGVSEVELERRDIENATRIEASHDGYAKSFGFVHFRRLDLNSDGLTLSGEDNLRPHGRGKQHDETPFTINFHLGEDIEVGATDNPQEALLRLSNGHIWQFSCSAGQLSLDDSLFIDENGQPQATQQLIIAAKAEKGGRAISWQFKFLG